MGALKAGTAEALQDAISHIGKLADRCCDTFSLHRSSFIERYMQSDGHICIRNISGGFNQYGFLLEVIPIANLDPVMPKCGVKTYSSWKYERVQEAPMFPGQVQLMEGAEQVVPSRIWLQRFDHSLMDIGKPLYLFQRSGVAVGQELLLACPDWEMGAFGVGMPISSRKGTCQQIKTATDAVEDHAGFGVNKGVEWLDISEAVKLFSGLRVCVYNDGVGLALSPNADTFNKNWELGTGPINCRLSI